MIPRILTLETLAEGYTSGAFTPRDVLAACRERIAAHADNPIWITVLDESTLEAHLRRLPPRPTPELPLYGVPFAIKDNIDLAGVPTTAGCPAYAYTPERSATAVQRLLEAGAIPLGKTNLDQFATGLVGTRSPYGACRNAIDPAVISGGSSSGSAVAVALGQVAFSLGTDTAGSGRVPASLNRLVGLKPTRGRVSTSGVVPACRSLDCVSIFAQGSGDARRVFEILDAFDRTDAFARRDRCARRAASPPRRIGVPRPAQLNFFGDPEGPGCFAAACDRLRAAGSEIVEVDFQPFLDAANLLYGGPWVAERFVAIEDFIEASAEALHPVTRTIIEGARTLGAVETFKAFHALEGYRRVAEAVWETVDVLATPTIGRPYTIAAVEADPVQLNTNLGYYTNFMNLLDHAALAVPAGSYASGFPFGLTLIAPANEDDRLLALAARLEGAPESARASGDDATLPIAVCGAHLEGLPLNPDLRALGATLRRATRTAPSYRLYALPGTQPPKPALVRVAAGGVAIEIEVWDLPRSAVGAFLATIPPPLGLGTVTCADGAQVKGFIAEAIATEGATDISHLGGWRAYLAQETVR